MEHKSEKQIVLLAMMILLVLGLGYFWAVSLGEKEEEKQSMTESVKVEVVRPDISARSSSKIPEGFPENIPLDRTEIIDSYRTEYRDHGIVLSVVSYVSPRLLEELWAEYLSFMNSAGYRLDERVSRRENGVVKGFLGTNELMVNIYTSGLQSVVTLTYTARE